MTEHRKIPAPGDAATPTLIERVGRGDALGSVGPPPIPEHLLKPARRRARERDVQPERVEAHVVETPVAAPVPAPAPPVPAAARALSRAAPVRFTGPLHAIDRAGLRAAGLIEPDGAVTALLEEVRIVKRHLLARAAELAAQGHGPSAQRVLVCSPLPGEGKTFTAVNLALAIAAEKESEVVLVDADFAKPSVLATLGLPPGPGLMDALADRSRDVADLVVATDLPGLWVLPAGEMTTSDSEYLSSSRTRTVLDRLVEGAPNRMVIFDSPPVLAASPAAEIAKYVGQALIVVRADTTGQGALEDAVSLLGGGPELQLLLNDVRFSPSGRRFGAYYGYGE